MAFPDFWLLYATLVVTKIDRHGVSNTERRECLPKKNKVMWYYVATEGPPNSSNKTEPFSYKVE